MKDPYDFTKNQIINTPIINYPYPHIHIKRIFPEEFYQEILDNIPSIEEYTPKPKYAGKQTSTLDRIDLLSESKRKFWGKMEKWFKSKDFSDLLLEKFNIRKEGFSDYFLHKDLEDFEIKPHRDLRSKLVTYLFYFPRDDSLPELGTQILVPKRGIQIPDTTEHQDWKLFNVVKSAEYLPNSFFSFMPSDKSYHSVKIKFPENIIKKERDTMRGFVFDKSGKDYPSYLFGKEIKNKS